MTQRGAYRRSVHDIHRHENVTDQASPNTTAIRNMSRWGYTANAYTPVSGTLVVVKITCEAGDVVTSINMSIGGTALATPTNQVAGIYTPDSGGAGGLAAKTLFGVQGADQTSATGSANSVKTLPLSGASVPITLPYSGDWYFAFSIAAGTMPTLNGQLVAPPIATGESFAAWTANTGLTATMPATLGTLTGINTVPYVELT